MIEGRSLKLLRALHFFLKSFYFFLNRIARYAQSKELEIFLRKFRKSPAKQFLEIAYILQPCGLQNVSAIVTTQNSHTFDP